MNRFIINHLNVMTQDIQKAYEFYKALGFKYIKNLGPKKIVFDYNGFDFFVEETVVLNHNPEAHFGFRTDKAGVYEFYELLKQLNIPLVKGNNPENTIYEMPNSERVALYFQDPDGNLIEVYSDI